MVKKFKLAFLATVIVLFAAGLIFCSSETVSAAKDALILCGASVIPALFPFFVLTGIITGLGWSTAIGRLFEPFMRPLFHTRGIASAPFIAGIIGGYPIGAKTAVSLYEQGECSKGECEQILSFCSNTGPGFFIGIIGIGIFSSPAAGIYLYICHVLSAIIVGIILRPKCAPHHSDRISARAQTDPVSKIFISSVQNSVSSIINVCGFVVLFAVIIRLITYAGIIGFLCKIPNRLVPHIIDPETAESAIIGIIELTSGVFSSGSLRSGLRAIYTVLSFITAFGGLSVHAQATAFILPAGLSAKRYVIGKMLHSVISSLTAWLLYPLAPSVSFPSSLTASARFSDAFTDFSRLSAAFTGILWLIFLIFMWSAAKKDGNLH